MKNQNGFTLIELVVVIVVLGILAAVAVPKFVSLKDDAALAAAKGVAGGLASASAINYAQNSVDNTKGTAVSACTDLTALLADGPTFGATGEYTVAGSFAAGAVEGDTADCTVTHNDTSKVANFKAIMVTLPSS